MTTGLTITWSVQLPYVTYRDTEGQPKTLQTTKNQHVVFSFYCCQLVKILPPIGGGSVGYSFNWIGVKGVNKPAVWRVLSVGCQ